MNLILQAISISYMQVLHKWEPIYAFQGWYICMLIFEHQEEEAEWIFWSSQKWNIVCKCINHL